MKVFETLTPIFMVAGLILISTPGFAITVNTEASEPSIKGEPITVNLKLASQGVEQGPSFPLDPAEGSVGESLELGDLDETEQRRAQLQVQLPWGSYFRDVTPQEIKNGTVDLVVYPSDPDAEVTVGEHGVLVQPFPRRVMIREFVVLKNNGDGLSGGENNPIEFDLPSEVERIIPGRSMADREDLVREETNFRYRKLVPPGETVLGFFYMINVSDDTYRLDRTVRLPTERILYRIPEYDSLNVQAQGLERASVGKQSKKSSPSSQFMASNLDVGDEVSLTFEGLNQISPKSGMDSSRAKESQKKNDDPLDRPSTFSSVSWPLMIGIGFSLFIFVVSYGYVQYRLAGSTESGISEEFLLDEIARLDQEYDDGAIPEAYYKRTRRRLKSRVEELDSDESNTA